MKPAMTVEAAVVAIVFVVLFVYWVVLLALFETLQSMADRLRDGDGGGES